ncbi:hypothetical protein APHCRT_1413 [Anaplasma phagocytophilum str. CRT53-1]|uniref:Uncharacterized protein n=1 Tax=Anaplasma phagocytophilum str. CRT53-1 TaxID=1359157 RepID=A0A0F3PS20_ANAPH|nr:hypothetical protein APHCRT_1413 [Anaplasma phagocytophilum str. CRT53-1]
MLLPPFLQGDIKRSSCDEHREYASISAASVHLIKVCRSIIATLYHH